jgi:hypothetical protein
MVTLAGKLCQVFGVLARLATILVIRGRDTATGGVCTFLQFGHVDLSRGILINRRMRLSKAAPYSIRSISQISLSGCIVMSAPQNTLFHRLGPGLQPGNQLRKPLEMERSHPGTTFVRREPFSRWPARQARAASASGVGRSGYRCSYSSIAV